MTARKAAPAKTIDDVWNLITGHVIPRLEKLEDESKKLGWNGHTSLLLDFLDDQTKLRARRETREKFFTDIKGSLGWMVKPRVVIGRLIKWLFAVIVVAYLSAVFYGKAPFPPPIPFLH